jgi:hypothetical protein
MILIPFHLDELSILHIKFLAAISVASCPCRPNDGVINLYISHKLPPNVSFY